MTNWSEHWAHAPRTMAPGDYLRQVGKTYKGEPISPEQVEAHISDACAALSLGDDDVLLDLCCGNGVITTRLAERCRRVVGVDFSEPLIEIAQRVHAEGGTTYHCASVLELDSGWITRHGPFTRVLMNEALQHFQEWDLEAIVAAIMGATPAPTVLAFTGVPDYRRKWHFYNTPEWRAEYLKRQREGREAIGTWWAIEHFEDVAERFGLICEQRAQNPTLHSARYRMDVRLELRPVDRNQPNSPAR